MSRHAEQSRAFLEAIRDDPDDDSHRLIFADWLDDNGDPDRAEFIRAQCELARPLLAADRRAALQKRETELLQAHRAAWLGPLHRVVTWEADQFRRGFLEVMKVRPRTMIDLADEFRARVPAAIVNLYGGFGAPALKALATAPGMEWVAGLRFEYPRMPESGLIQIGESAGLPRLTAITIQGGAFTSGGLRTLFTSPHRQALRRLSLDLSSFRNTADPDSAAELSNAEVTFRLQTLRLPWLQISTAGAVAFAGAEHLADLRELGLAFNEIGDEGVLALARSPHLRNLTTFDLMRNQLTARAVQAFSESTLIDGIRHLTLSQNKIGDDGARMLAACPRLGQLAFLELRSTGITDAGVEALAASPFLANLTEIDFGVNELSDRGSQALLDSPHLRRLERIHIGGQVVGEKLSPAQRKLWLKRLGKGARV